MRLKAIHLIILQAQHWCGTDDRGRDVFARLAYGFNIGLSFAIIVTFLTYMIGIAIGAALGFYGGKVDIFGLRLIEIWRHSLFYM